MKYGPNSTLVEEVVSFVEKHGVLSGQGIVANVSFIADFSEAQRLAWDKTYGQMEFLWSDIRESKMAEVRGLSYQSDRVDAAAKESLTGLLKKFTLLVKRSLDNTHEAILDDAVADLHNCAFSRAVCGIQNEFFESLFSIYCAGGWPCGWEGDYPSGRIVAYRQTVSSE